VPSCAWVMLWTIASPRPTPAWSVRTRSSSRRNGSASVETIWGASFSPVFSTVSSTMSGRALRSSNSFEYFLACAISRDFSLRQANPGLEVSVKHRMAQRRSPRSAGVVVREPMQLRTVRSPRQALRAPCVLPDECSAAAHDPNLPVPPRSLQRALGPYRSPAIPSNASPKYTRWSNFVPLHPSSMRTRRLRRHLLGRS
jgi:hypothetical protein